MYNKVGGVVGATNGKVQAVVCLQSAKMVLKLMQNFRVILYVIMSLCFMRR